MGIALPFSTLVEMFVYLTDKFGPSDKPMLLRKTEGRYMPMSYSEVRIQVERFAHGLTALGMKRGDRIAILSENRPEWVITDMAALSLGCVDVPIFPSQTAKQVEYILNDCGAVAIVVSNQFQLNKVLKARPDVPSLKHIIIMNAREGEQHATVHTFSSIVEMGAPGTEARPDFLRQAAESIKPEELCTIIYTSGTTGDPKGVMLTHQNFVSNIKSSAQIISIESTDVLLSFLPLSHSFERMAGYYTGMACGASIAYAESIETVAENLLEVRPTVVCSVPRLFERIHQRIARHVEKDTPVKRRIFYWAIGVGREYAAAFKKGSVPLLLAFRHGLADRLVFSKLRARTGGRIRYFVSGGAALPREFGEFFEAVGVKIIEGYGLTETSPVISVNPMNAYKFGSVGKAIPGVEVKIAEDGEILTRGPNVMLGYYNNRKATDEMIDRDGWLHTGDIGMMDSDGYLYITDRKKHLFVSSGGKNIAPQPIENLFSSTDLIDQFILIGDKRMFLTALIVPDFESLKAYADEHGIPYKSIQDLVKNREIHQLIEEKIQKTQRDLANYEKVRRFTLLENAFSIENGEMTPTMKFKRRTIEERYKELIEAMYQT